MKTESDSPTTRSMKLQMLWHANKQDQYTSQGRSQEKWSPLVCPWLCKAYIEQKDNPKWLVKFVGIEPVDTFISDLYGATFSCKCKYMD